jgi:hypothetical protein
LPPWSFPCWLRHACPPELWSFERVAVSDGREDGAPRARALRRSSRSVGFRAPARGRTPGPHPGRMMPGRADDQPLVRDHDSDVLQGARRAAPCPAQHRSRSLPRSSRSRHSVRAGRRISGNRALTPRTGFRTTHKCPAPCQHLSACRRGGFAPPLSAKAGLSPSWWLSSRRSLDDGLMIGLPLSLN